MTCEEVSAVLPELLGGNLPRDKETAVLEHLAGCAACRKELAFWAQLCSTMKTGEPQMPEALFEAVGERLNINQKVTVQQCVRILKGTLGLTDSVIRMAFSLALRN
jgi:predicted anti-sigma-YlaC factor YlaD